MLRLPAPHRPELGRPYLVGLSDVVHVERDALQDVVPHCGGALVQEAGRCQDAEEDVVDDDEVEVLQPVGAAELTDQVIVGDTCHKQTQT